jgi:hypothetical protein
LVATNSSNGVTSSTRPAGTTIVQYHEEACCHAGLQDISDAVADCRHDGSLFLSAMSAIHKFARVKVSKAEKVFCMRLMDDSIY